MPEIVTPTAEAAAFVQRQHQLFINNSWQSSQSGTTFATYNPATGLQLCRVAEATVADVDNAVTAAREAFDDPGSEWSRTRPRERQNMLWKLADLMERDAQVLAELECLNNGKSAAVARIMDVQLSIDTLRYMAGWATKLSGASIDVSVPLMPDAEFHAFTRREPIGVVGAIVTWNFPLLLACWKLAPALATGCTVVMKPADETPLSVLKLAELVQEAGYPKGVFNVITGGGAETGAAISAHPGINKITFPGSTNVGKIIGKAAMNNMTRLTLELGGKSPTIVLEDANIGDAIAGAANAIFFNHGQVCSAGSRLYIHRKHFDAVTRGIADIANNLKLGDGMDPTVDMGPLITEKQQKQVQNFINEGRELGAKVLCGGESFGPGHFVQPTVMVNIDQRFPLVQEEIFGPVLVAIPFDDEEEAIKLANDNAYGLGASIWSNNLAAVHRMIPRIRSGSVWVNCHSALDPALPFGGYKMSGFGREMGEEALHSYTEHKSVLIKL